MIPLPDFIPVPAPVYTPTQCATCSSQHDGEGFLDLLVDLPVSGHLYMCASCVRQAATAMGWTEPRLVAEQAGRLDDERAEVERLKAALEFEREHKTISANDLAAWVNRAAEGQAARAPYEQTFEEQVVSAKALYDEKTHDLCPECDRPKRKQSKTCHDCYIASAKKTLGSGSPVPTTAGTTG